MCRWLYRSSRVVPKNYDIRRWKREGIDKEEYNFREQGLFAFFSTLREGLWNQVINVMSSGASEDIRKENPEADSQHIKTGNREYGITMSI